MKIYFSRVWTPLVLTLATLAASAADRTWTGGGSDNLWSTPANWGGTAPTAGDSLFFGGGVRTSPINNFPAGTVFQRLTINSPASAFTITGNGISLGGDATVADYQPLVPQTINLPLALNGPSLSHYVHVAADGLLTLGGVISGPGAIVKSGDGLVTLGAQNTFTGGIVIGGGTISVAADSNLGAVPASPTASIMIDGGVLRATSSFSLNANRSITLGSPIGLDTSIGTLRVNAGSTLTYGGVIANGFGAPGTLEKNGFGGLTLSGANTYTGPTIVQNGTLTLDFAPASAPANNIISSSSALTMGGGTAGLGAASFDALVVNGKTGVASSQNFNGTTIIIGPAIIRANSGSGGSANISLGALTSQPGGVLNVVPPTLTGGAGAISTTTANTHGVIGGWATVGNGTVYRNITMGTEWATVDGSGNIVPYTGYTVYGTGETLHGNVTAGTNLRINSTSTGDVTVNAPDAGTVTDINTINVSESRGHSIVIGNGNTLRLGRYGSIFKSDFANSITWALGSGTTAGGNGVQDSGTLTAGGADNTPGDIVFYMNNNASQSAGSLNVECKVTDNGSGAVTVVKASTASMKFRGHNTFSGGLYVLQGRFQLAGSEIGTPNPDGAGTGPVYVYPGAYFFLSGIGDFGVTGVALSNNCFIAGLGTDQEQVGAIRFGNGVRIAGDVTLTGDSRIGGGNATTLPNTGISGKISGNYNFDIGALGTINTHISLFNPANDWTGQTTLNARNNGSINNVRSGASEVFPHGVGRGNVTLNGNNPVGTINWDLNGFNETINGLASAGTVSGCFILNNLSGTTSTLTVGDYDQSATYGGVIQNGAGGLGVVALTKIGGGKQTLTGANTYSGITTISNGTLALSGAGSIASSIAINAHGGTLDVSELTPGFSYASAIDVNNGGLVIRTAGIAALNMAEGRVSVAGLGSSPVVAEVATLTTGGSANHIDIASMGAVTSYPATFTIIKYTGTIGGAGFNFALGNVLTPSTTGYVTNNEANSSVDLVLLDGPKPLTWTGLLGPVWDINTTPNWLAFGTTPSVYLDVDSTFFTDTGASGTVDLTTTLQPSAVVVNNDTRTYTFTGTGKISGPASLTKDGPGTLILANSGTNDFFGPVNVNAGTVQVGNGGTAGNISAGSVVNNSRLLFNRSDNVTVGNVISGGGLLEQNGTGILTLAGNNNSFTGEVLVAQSTLRPASGTALGTVEGRTRVSPDATLDVNGQNLGGEPVLVSGAGVGGNGVIVNTAGAQQNALRNVTLASDVVFGGTSRWDIRDSGGPATLSSGATPYKITKVGANQVSLVGVAVDAALGDVEIREGMLSIETSTTGLGDIFNNLIVHSNATLAFFNLNPNALNKIITLQDGAIVFNQSGSSLVDGSITLDGTATFNASSTGSGQLSLRGPVSGPGTLLKTGAGALLIASGNTATHTGPTRVNAGFLLVDGSVTDSPITASGGTLGGFGSIMSPVTISTNGRLAPGGNVGLLVGTLTIDVQLNLQGTTVMDVGKVGGAISGDSVAGFSALTYGGTLQLNLGGEPLADGDALVLFSFSSATGAFTSIVPATPGPGLAWDTSTLTTDGTLRVTAPTVFEFGSVTIVGSDAVYEGGGGPANGQYRVLCTTNIALPAIQWEPVATNTFDASGNFNFTLPIDPAVRQRFYILSY